MKIFMWILLFIVIAAVVIFTNLGSRPSLPEWLLEMVNFSSQTEKDAEQEPATTPPAKKELTTNISPARNLTGRWIGNDPQGAVYRQSSTCEYDASLIFNLKQDNNAVSGIISFSHKSVKDLDAEDFTPCPPTGYLTGDFSINGSISGTNINFETAKILGDPSLPIKFKGTFTNDILSGDFERLPYSSSQLAELSRVKGTWIVTKSR